MSALPVTVPDPQPAPRGVQWIDLAEAARRSGWTDGHLKRFCPAWQRNGFADKRRPPDGGKARWYVREDADARLARVASPGAQPFDDRHLTDKQRMILNDKLAIVQRWEEAWRAAQKLGGFTKDKVTAHFLLQLQINDGRQVSRATLYNWLAAYQRDGKAGLVDPRWKADQGDAPADDPFLDFVRRTWLNLREPRLTRVHEAATLLAHEQGWAARSYKTCQRMIDAIPEPEKIRFRQGAKAFTDKVEPFIERDYSTLASNDVWCGDHHQLDLIIAHEGKLLRPWLTAWQDMRSRKIIGWRLFAHDPNQDTILLAFRDGVLTHGVPSRVYIDNGKDYDSFALQGMTKRQRRKLRVTYDAKQIGGLFGGLGVAATHCQPYHGQSKPIERWFRELSEVFCKTYVTYTGNAPENKPEDLAVHLKRGEAPTLEELTAAFAGFLTGYHGREHRGDAMDGRSPDQAFAECMVCKRTAPAELLDLLLMKIVRQPNGKPIRVLQNGVVCNGLRYGQYEPELTERLGKVVQLRYDPADMSRVVVFDEAGRFVCVAHANRQLPQGADHQLLREAQQRKGHIRRVVKEAHQVRMQLVEDQTDTMIRAAAERNRAAGTDRVDPTLPPVPVQRVQSPFDDQLSALQRGLERRGRVAVGAESTSLQDLAAAFAPDVDGADEEPAANELMRLADAVREQPGDP